MIASFPHPQLKQSRDQRNELLIRREEGLKGGKKATGFSSKGLESQEGRKLGNGRNLLHRRTIKGKERKKKGQDTSEGSKGSKK